MTWGDILVPYSVYNEVLNTYKKEGNDFILVTNFSDDPHKGGAVYCKDDYCLNIVEKPAIGESKSNMNNCGVFILSVEIFEVLNFIKPSNRNEIELTEAIKIGIVERQWNFRVVKMGKNQFRGDFGDKKIFERLRDDPIWLKELGS